MAAPEVMCRDKQWWCPRAQHSGQGDTQVSRVHVLKSLKVGCAAAFGGALLALLFGLAAAAQSQELFTDDFEGGIANGWTTSGGSWSVVTDGSQVYKQSATSNDARARAGSPSWTDYAVQARVKPLAFPGSNNGRRRFRPLNY